MRVVAVTSQKGGSGKTTLSGHLAVEAVRQGAGKVALIDTDPQGSLAAWWNARESNDPAFAQTSIYDLEADLNALREENFQLVIIDTPPAITRSIQAVVAKSDLVIIPTRPSPHDLRAAGATVDLVERAGKPLVFVINAATPRARLTTEAAIALSAHGAVAPTVIHNRQDFAASMIDGRTVMEAAPSSKSTEEIEALWAFVDERIRRLPVKAGFKTVHQPRTTFGRAAFGGSPLHAVS
ncbi:AAA family ATPase [Pseudokordiimonas caeni]|uniref:AAA family ATPase n=1 Tax=Pseudokordiimonas caeni TaxID=2997908 RepID=UPI0035942202